MKKLLYILMPGLFLLNGCKEYTPPELEPGNDPIFSVQGNVDGNVIDLAADGSNQQAYSTFDSDSLGIIYYEGGLKPCSDCDHDFRMKWRDASENNPSLTETVMESNPIIRYIQGTDSSIFYDINITADAQSNAVSYEWNILGDLYTTPTVSLSIPQEQGLSRFAVELIVTYDDGCTGNIIDTLYLPNHGCDCTIDYKQRDSAGLSFVYVAQASGGDSYDYQWTFESGAVVSSREVTQQFPSVPMDGVEEILAEVDAGDCRATRKVNQFFPGANTGCAANFNYDVTMRVEYRTTGVGIDLGEIELSYRDEEGNFYQSLLVPQDEESFFRIESVEEYIDPYISSDERSIKVEASFNCLMRNQSEIIRISEGKLVLPIGLGAD